MYEEDGPGYNLIHEEFTPARPTSLPISSSTDLILDDQRKRLRNCRKTLDATEKESKIMDLEIAKLQLKIQECLDKTASNDRLEHELNAMIENQLKEKDNQKKLINEMSFERQKSGESRPFYNCYDFVFSGEAPLDTVTIASLEEEWACPVCSAPNNMVWRTCGECGHTPTDINNCVILRS
ncbi:uncharacterized protein LOC134812886 isoform X1 [Bolinopsis microptera]|uniref:uncharacterized protein LOC134812886 isoform X1 n=1 Tax=Bolinopsis microptera TaxID=2820187 RepID=UPI00307B07AC